MAIDTTRYDLQLNGNDLVINNTGDFVIGPSDEQHIADCINAFPGWWKQYPLNGFGLRQYMQGPADAQIMNKNLRLQLETDGYQASPVISLNSTGNLNIDPGVTI
jgi:hypothetical protein